MCGCAVHQAQGAATVPTGLDALVVKVEDMTCGHCASTITKAVRAGLPDADVQADPTTKLVTVRGAADRAAVETLIAGAGYTPAAMPA